MKSSIFVSLLIIGAFSNNLQAQSTSVSQCTESEYHQFDFWIGEWDVFDTTGNLVGTNNIYSLQEGCVIQENWQSEKSGYTGTSYNYYNKTDKTWNQVWIDNQGGILELKGNFNNNKMVLKSELLDGQKTPLYYNQISWELLDDGKVLQTWQTFDQNNNLLKTLFKGIYQKK